MATTSENTTPTIFRKDPNLPSYIDFKTLRKEGLEHIGNLAGRIWTDHNVHDPGITILEVLIYALMDLGYRTNLPFEELIASSETTKEDNFLTPLQILTINPVTIMDYRKLLLEIEEVRNAWLEPVDTPSKIYVDQRNNRLICNRPDPIEPGSATQHFGEGSVTVEGSDECIATAPFLELQLNGLYRVYIEKDTTLVTTAKKEKDLVNKVKKRLSAHRNLCEDILDICVLEPIDFGFCIEAEILPGNDPEKI